MHRFALLALLICITSSAEIIHNPDPNTLWIENGENIKTDPVKGGRQGWLNTTMDISCTPAQDGVDGYFTFKSPESKKHSTRRYLPIKKEYPWLIFEVDSYVPIAAQYKNFWMGIYKAKTFSINVPRPGIYLQNVWQTTPFEKAIGLVQFSIYGYEVNFKYIKMVKEPENYFCVDSPAFAEKKCFRKGDKLVFTAKLAAQAEDVTITFHDIRDHRPIRINGNDSITLKPTNGEITEWRAECDVNSISSKETTFIFKCTVLGGKLRKPMYTANPFPYKKEDSK